MTFFTTEIAESTEKSSIYFVYSTGSVVKNQHTTFIAIMRYLYADEAACSTCSPALFRVFRL